MVGAVKSCFQILVVSLLKLNMCFDNKRNNDDYSLIRAQWLTKEKVVAFIRELVSRLVIVAAVCLVLFAVSGLWPPTSIVGSPSMAPNLRIGDLVFIMEEHRFAGVASHAGTGVVTYQTGVIVGYKEFNNFGDVIVYNRNGNEQLTPVIHRARFWVSKNENWYDEANQTYLSEASNCEELANCPAEHAGFITKGDSNPIYDQVGADPISEPVKSKWIIGTAEFRIPWLGRIRLLFGMAEYELIPKFQSLSKNVGPPHSVHGVSIFAGRACRG
jgi:signal peptidase